MFNEDTVKNYVKYRFEADRQDLIRQVRKVTGITRPIYGVEVVGDFVRVRCYGGKVVDVPVSALPERPDPCEAYDNLGKMVDAVVIGIAASKLTEQEEGAASAAWKAGAPTSAVQEDGGPYDDFTVIPGVGKRTAQKLRDAGVLSLAQLRAGWDEWIRDAISGVVTKKTLESIELYLKEVER